MSLFVDKVITRDDSAIQVEMCWHPQMGLLARASFSEDLGGVINLVDKYGYDIDEGIIPRWDSGEIYLFSNQQCTKVDSSHNSPVHLAEFSSQGSSLITADKSGTIVGWKTDGGGGTRLELLFHHELKDQLTGLSFCPSASSESSLNLTGLARAAVAGDEKALDLFSSWRPNMERMQAASSGENLNAYAGSANGVIYYLNENGSCMEVLQADGSVKKLLTWNNILIVITENMVIGQFQMEADGSVREVSRVKLSTRMKENHISWVTTGQLAITSGEMNIRIWNLKNDDNYVLNYEQGDKPTSEFITCISYSSAKGILSAGTNSGYIVMWQCLTAAAATNGTDAAGDMGEESWKCLPRVHIGNAIRNMHWGGGSSHVLALNTIRQVFFLSEQTRALHFNNGVSAIQTSPNDLAINFYNSESPIKINSPVPVEKIFLTDGNVFIYGTGHMVCFEVQKEIRHVMLAGEFDIPSCDGISAHDQSIYTLEGERINVRSFLGIIKQTLTLTENEGHATHVDVFGKFLVVGTSNAYVKIWDLSKRDARLHVHPIHLRERIPDFQRIGEVKLNSTGAFLSVCNSTGPGQPISCDSFLYVLDLESSSNAATRYFNFNSGRNETDDHAVPPNSAQSTASASSLLLDTSRSSLTGGAAGNKDHLGGRILLKHDWDQSEPHFLVCQTKSMSTGTNELFVSMFFHEEYGLIVHDRLRSGSNHSKLVGIDVPFVYIFDENEKLDELSDSVRQVLLKDFEGLDASDKVTKDAVVKFCFYLSIGNMDEAFRAIKMIDNKKVWGNLARMCVKSRRLDVATICLGKMEHSCGARAMRRILAAKVSKDIQVAILAIYLNMHEEAEKVLLKSGQYELLNKFYQDSGKWQKALDIAEKYDRIHLRSTNYNYAKHLESKFDIAGAIAYYDKSGTSRFEVPRLLFEDWNALESYVNKSDDKSLKRWLAQYLESAGEMELALQYYELAEDYLSLVRVHCYCENLEKAAEIANSSGDKAACYHLARQYENMDNISNAIHFFSKASAYSNAIRICKEQGYADHIWNLALLASNNEKLDAAKYFERCEKPQYDKAVILYEKAGYFGKALDLAVRTNQHNALQHISKHLDGDTDPVLLGKAANFFLDNRQYDKAVDLFVSSKENQKALDLCLQYNITVTEDMAEKLTMDKSGNTNNELLNNMAEVCYRQGNYTLATKKWTQAGNRLQAMKALLKSGDTEKVIKFANISRERDIYILAANYLQTLDWRNDADIMRNIIAFYQKSKAFDLLGWFYQACADVEIDEYQNYEKALGALNECVKCLERSEEVPETKIASVMRQIDLVTRFVGYQRSYAATGAEAAIEGCRALLQEQDINASVRKGDIYGFLIEHYAKSQNFRAAQQMVEELRKGIPNVNLAYYISSEVLRDLEKATGIPLATAGVGGADDDEVGEEIVEEQD